MNLADVVTVIFISAGMFFFIAGTVGLLRFPDVFSRLHALTKADNVGLGLVVLGLLPQMASVFVVVQMLFTWALVMIAGAVASYLIANHALGSRTESLNARQSTAGSGQKNA